MNILPLAYRNIWRRKTRAFTTIGAMAFAGAIMILYVALMEGIIDAMERNVVTMNLGDIQIHAQGYLKDPDLYKTIADYRAIIAILGKQGFDAAPRLYGFGLAAHEAESTGVSIRGVDMALEAKVTKTHENLLRGQWLDKADPKGIVLGWKLAKTLGAMPGAQIVLVSQSTDGAMANEMYSVRGVLKGIADTVDRGGLFMTETAFRELMGVPEGTHEIVLLRRDRQEPLEAALPRAKAATAGYEVKSWKELQPIIARVISTSRGGIYVMVVIMYSAVAMVALNAMLMSVFERIQEFGVMKAIGVSPWQIMALVLAEAAVQTAIACALAMAIAIPIGLRLQEKGIDLSSVSTKGVSVGGVAMNPIWYANLTPQSVYAPMEFLALIVLAAVIYPGIKAAIIDPVQAIHHI
jgi:ABC-type lipoprotein release transport system permease subunit